MLSKEGTTQDDPLAMAIHVIETSPLIRKLEGVAKQVWYTDDSTVGSSLEDSKNVGTCSKNVGTCWLKGPLYAYLPNDAKTHIITKPE